MRPLLLLLVLLAPLLATAAAPLAGLPSAPPTGPAAERKFVAVLTGEKQIPPSVSRATARATFFLSDDGAEVRYRITVARLSGVTLAALRRGREGATGEPAAILFGPRHLRGESNGLLVEGAITARDLIGSPGGSPSLTALIDAMREQTVYVEIDTADFPAGEIRGQVHADRRRTTDL
jgi:CHRD domain